MLPDVNDPDVISKSEFARRRNVKPPRVTQWIAAKKIFGDAIVGEGRDARIRESIACQQLNRTLDPLQRLGNGLGTRLEISTGASPLLQLDLPPDADGVLPLDGDARARPPASMTTHDMIAEQKLIQIKRQNERDLIEDAKIRGDLVDAAAASAQQARASAQLLLAIEGQIQKGSR